MDQKVENLSPKNLKKTFIRLKKDTKNFSKLIVRDTLDFLDFEVDLESNLGSIVYEVNTSNYHPQKPYLHLSAKNKGINRPTVVFDVKDALVYRFCVEQIEDELFAKTRQKNVRGGIKITAVKNEDGDDYYEKWFDDWLQHNEDLRKCLSKKGYLVSTDIASYFENINILILRDLIRSDVESKGCILNLMFYFLENTRFRNLYEVNTYTGLPQEDIDCSRVLAYYFLKSHDEEMAEFCKESSAEFYRFVDDMSIAVESEVTGKKALKRMTESLRRLNLVSSIEKTSIMESQEAQAQLFFEENDNLSDIESCLFDNLKNNYNLEEIIQKTQSYYTELVNNGKGKHKNWIKILKRFYTICTYAQMDFLMADIPKHVIEFPTLFLGDKIGKYLIRNQRSSQFRGAISNLIDYLYSDENLYPVLESNLLEILLLVNPDALDIGTKDRLKKICNDIFFHESGYNALSDYARAIACLIFYRYDKQNLERVVKHYIKASEKDYLLRKYMIFVSLTIKNDKFRRQVLDKAKTEQHPSISRLINLIEKMDKYKNKQAVKNYIKRKDIYIYFDAKDKFEIKASYDPIRIDILEELISIYSSAD